jgi:Recombination endonuclease VII
MKESNLSKSLDNARSRKLANKRKSYHKQGRELILARNRKRRAKKIEELGREEFLRLEKERRERYKSDPEKARKLQEAQWRRRYKDFTLQDYNTMLEKQNNACAICHMPETRLDARSGKVNNLSVDHCHATGKIRGLLCNKCNKGLGHFNDNLELFHSIIKYLTDNT